MFGLSKSKKKSIPAKILVIDDEPDLVSTIQCRLEWCNFEVVTAGNGEEGLEKAASEKPVLILLDIDMPDINGIEFLKILRKQGDTTPIIVFTGVGGEYAAIEALNNGANFFSSRISIPVCNLIFRADCFLSEQPVLPLRLA